MKAEAETTNGESLKRGLYEADLELRNNRS